MRATAAVLLVLCLLAISHAWDCQTVVDIYNLMQIDAGLGQVVATNTSQIPFYLVGDKLVPLPGSLRHITIGPAGIWGVNSGNILFKYVVGNWQQYATGVKQVDAGGAEFIVGATMDYSPFCLESSFTLGFKDSASRRTAIRLAGSVKYLSCGPFGCWAVNNNDDIFLMSNVNKDTCQNQGWNLIDGKLSMIEVATDGSVFGVNSLGDVYTRDGITASKPEGTGWSNVPMYMPMTHVTYDLGRLWVVSKSGVTMVCKR